MRTALLFVVLILGFGGVLDAHEYVDGNRLEKIYFQEKEEGFTQYAEHLIGKTGEINGLKYITIYSYNTYPSDTPGLRSLLTIYAPSNEIYEVFNKYDGRRLVDNK